MPQLSPILWMIFPFFLLMILVVFFMEVGKSEKLSLEVVEKSFMMSKIWKW